MLVLSNIEEYFELNTDEKRNYVIDLLKRISSPNNPYTVNKLSEHITTEFNVSDPYTRTRLSLSIGGLLSKECKRSDTIVKKIDAIKDGRRIYSYYAN